MPKLYETTLTTSPSAARILILGLPGSGKSTLAKSFTKNYGIRHIESDRYAHRTDFINAIEDEIQSDGFVLEGRFKDLKDLLVKQRWTQVIWLDHPRWLTTWRLLSRELKHFGLKAFSKNKTFRFYLRNHKRLHSYQAKAFQEFSQNNDIKTIRLS